MNGITACQLVLKTTAPTTVKLRKKKNMKKCQCQIHLLWYRFASIGQQKNKKKNYKNM